MGIMVHIMAYYACSEIYITDFSTKTYHRIQEGPSYALLPHGSKTTQGMHAMLSVPSQQSFFQHPQYIFQRSWMWAVTIKRQQYFRDHYSQIFTQVTRWWHITQHALLKYDPTLRKHLGKPDAVSSRLHHLETPQVNLQSVSGGHNI